MFKKTLFAKLFIVCLLLVCFCSIEICQSWDDWNGDGYVFPYYGTKATYFTFFFGPENNNYFMIQNESLNRELLNLAPVVVGTYIHVNEEIYGCGGFGGRGGFSDPFLCGAEGENLNIGNNQYYFTCKHPMWGDWKSQIFDGPVLSEEKIQFDLRIPYFFGNPFWTLYISTINKSQRGVVYFVFINQTIPDEIYSAPDGKKGIKPLGTYDFPPNYFIDLNVDILFGDFPSFKLPEAYTYAIAAFDPESYELISNIATCTYEVK